MAVKDIFNMLVTVAKDGNFNSIIHMDTNTTVSLYRQSVGENPRKHGYSHGAWIEIDGIVYEYSASGLWLIDGVVTKYPE